MLPVHTRLSPAATASPSQRPTQTHGSDSRICPPVYLASLGLSDPPHCAGNTPIIGVLERLSQRLAEIPLLGPLKLHHARRQKPIIQIAPFRHGRIALLHLPEPRCAHSTDSVIATARLIIPAKVNRSSSVLKLVCRGGLSMRFFAGRP